MDMDEEEEGEVFTRRATKGHCWERCGNDGTQQRRRGRGCVVNSRSWAEELQDICVRQAEEYYSGGQARRSSISVSDCAVRDSDSAQI